MSHYQYGTNQYSLVDKPHTNPMIMAFKVYIENHHYVLVQLTILLSSHNHAFSHLLMFILVHMSLARGVGQTYRFLVT